MRRIQDTGRNEDGGGRGALLHRPVVGMDADADPDRVAGTVLRAIERGHDVLVAAGDADSESARFAESLGADVVPLDRFAQDENGVRRTLAREARDRGYPGVLYKPGPDGRIDYDSGREIFLDGERYLVEVPTRPPGIEAPPEVMVAVPAYNEASSIADVVEAAEPRCDHVLVVDDGSDDDTAQRAREAGAHVVQHETNRGYGAALKTAFRYGHRADVDHLVILDGDGQHDPADIPALIEGQRETKADVVIGSRFVSREGKRDVPLYRRLGLFAVNVMTNLSHGVIRSRSWVNDTQSGFRSYGRRAVASLARDASIGENMGASTDILYHAHHNDLSMEEVPTTVRYDVEDASHHNPVKHGLHLVANILKTVERDRPILLLGLPGFLLTFAGLVVGYGTVFNYLRTTTFPTGLALTSTVLLMVGLFSGFTAIILHSLNTLELDR